MADSNSQSITVNTTASPQPFQCQICQSRFTRHENLKRHAAVHARSTDKASFTCDFCQISFSRQDLRLRHVKRKHADKLDGNGVSKRSQHDSTTATTREERSGSRGSVARSLSSFDTSYGLQNQQSFQNFGMEIDSWVGNMVYSDPNQQLNNIHVQDHQPLTSRSNPSPRNPVTGAGMATHSPESWSHTQNMAQTEARPIAARQESSNQLDNSMRLDQASYDSNMSYHFSDRVNSPSILQSGFAEVSPMSGSPRPHIPDGISSKDVPYLQDDWFPSPTQTARGYQLYFNHVTQFVPFIHRPTFDATETARHLGLSMLCLAYQYGEDPDCSDQVGTGASLSLRCFHRARVLAAMEEEENGDMISKITLVQTYWLLQVCVMMYYCGDDSAYGFKMHSRMISLARFGGLTQALPPQPSTSEDLDELWRDFIEAESHKRTLLAVHQIDALWYQLFSIPRSLSHLEIKHDLPCRAEYWTASSSAQWAHRQLASKPSAAMMPYSEAVRCFLSPAPDIESLPAFDLYGIINIAQFLLSSARELSGWSTMTGRLSLERLEPLRLSLLALESVIRPQAKTVTSIHATTCEATWEIAMIELLIWSPSHTSGIVGNSVDAFLSHSTYLATSCKIVTEPNAVSAVQPHIDWFLLYLDSTSDEDSEPPWIDLYAYKAFLTAWQLLKEGIPGVMQVVGLHDGDIAGAISWAKKAFHRKQRPQLSKLFNACLDTLNT